jgi:hypothetical protein
MAIAHLTWTPGGGVEQDVKYRRFGDESFTLHSTVGTSVTSADISGLDDNAVYEFEIVNRCFSDLETPSSVVEGADVTCPGLSVEQAALSLTVSFTHLGGDITSYTVEVYEMPGETFVTSEDVVSFPSPVEVTFTGLTSGVYYKIKVIPKIASAFENDTCEIEERTLECSEGYTLAPDGSYCYLIEETAADPPTGGTPESTVAATATAYSTVGSYIYDPGYSSNGVGTWTQIPLINTFWVNGPGTGADNTTTDGPLNRCGLWTTSALSNQDIGFSVCLDLPATSVYYIGLGGDNKCRFTVDGVVVVDQDITAVGTNTGWGAGATFKIWHIYPVTLSAGPHIIELIGHNNSGVAALGAEIYQNTDAEIMAATSYTGTGLNLIFSTKDYIGQPVQLGSDDLGYTCPTGYSLAACVEPVVCRRILTELPS